MDIEELRRLMADMESDRVERTVSKSDASKLAQAACAFANDLPRHRLPGYLLIGVDDKTGDAVGLTITDEDLRNLAGLRADGNILPIPAITVERHHLSDTEGDVAVVTVLPSDLPPVRYKGQCWIRVGPRRAVASEMEERILSERRAALAMTFDARPCPGATLHDLTIDLFRLTYLPNAVSSDEIEANNRDVRKQLSSLRFYDLRHDSPTYAGVLLFGEDPLRYVPGAFVQFMRYRGLNLVDDVEDAHEFSGDLLTMLRELDSFVPLQVQRRPEAASAFREIMVEDYPVVALRELLMNAVMHRWYDQSTAPIRVNWFIDRVEIQSPGGLYGEATPENFPRQTAYRNPVLAEAMKVLGFVNRYGRGVLRAQDALARNGNPPAEFEFQPTFVLATVRRRL